MRYDRPSPHTEELQVRLAEARAVLNQRVDEPNRHVRDQQERDNLSAGLRLVLMVALSPSPPGVEDENRLNRCLNDRQNLREKPVVIVVCLAHREVAGHDAEHRVDVDAALCKQQKRAVQTDALLWDDKILWISWIKTYDNQLTILFRVLQILHLHHRRNDSPTGHNIQDYLAPRHLHHRRRFVVFLLVQHEEHDERDDGQNDHQDAGEHSAVGSRAVD